MKGRDYLWCLANTILDREEQLGRLCPSCRARALEERCSRCGRPAAEWEEGTDNPTFDPARFEELRGGCGVD
ncbi:MAG: molybdopterin oxidoreductase [Lawsonibacter sp.]|nr:molybdopterin oxidoreductase [Lawsonibacter sp.]MCI9269530.1 molybdopterin oxidoreductase [Lawsonibacter sp.]